MSKKGVFIAILLLLPALLTGLWFVNNFERVEIDSPSRYSGEAKYNPYYAARIFMREMGYDARTVDISTLKKTLPDQNDILIITTDRQTIREGLSEDILNWVATGGHLIIKPAKRYYKDNDEPNEDLILNRTGITAFYNFSNEYNGFSDTCSTDKHSAEGATDDQDTSHEHPTHEDQAKEDPVTEGQNTEDLDYEDDEWSETPESYTFSSDLDALEINFPSYNYLDGATAEDFTLYDSNGTRLIHRPYQKGAITILDSLDFFSNDSIGDYDHARVLIEISRLSRGSLVSGLKGKIWILHDESMPSILALLWTYALPLVVVSFLMFILWLPGALFRFGPLIPQPAIARRQFLEHIDASGKYFWKNKQQNKLVNSVRSALDHRVSQIIPGWPQLSKQQQRIKMAEILDMPERTLNELMDTDSDLHSQDFTRLIRQLDNARKRL